MTKTTAELRREIAARLATVAPHPRFPNHKPTVAECVEYAQLYKCTAYEAVRDVCDEYYCSACQSLEAARSGDWDYGRE